jgi:hypothetical protein
MTTKICYKQVSYTRVVMNKDCREIFLLLLLFIYLLWCLNILFYPIILKGFVCLITLYNPYGPYKPLIPIVTLITLKTSGLILRSALITKIIVIVRRNFLWPVGLSPRPLLLQSFARAPSQMRLRISMLTKLWSFESVPLN